MDIVIRHKCSMPSCDSTKRVYNMIGLYIMIIMLSNECHKPVTTLKIKYLVAMVHTSK